MNVSLTPELEDFIAGKVSSGRYHTASEVVREGLRLLEARDRNAECFMVSSLEELREKIREGIDSLNRGEYSSQTAGEIISKARKQGGNQQPGNG